MNIVYFLQRVNGDIKIGTTLTWGYNRRLRDLTKQHGELRLLGFIEGNRVIESQLHKKFAIYRLKNGRIHRKNRYDLYTEFFSPVNEILDFIETNSLGTTIPKKTKGNIP